MSTALDFIKAALRRINSYQSGEEIATPDANDCLETFNDLLDSWSTDKYQVFGSVENILQWNSGQSQYKIGNPTNVSLGQPNFIGGIGVLGLSTIIASSVPANLVVGATVTDQQNTLPAGTSIVSITGSVITLSAPASVMSTSDSFGFTIPGDFAIDRPLRITNAFTRFNNLDFTLEVYADQDAYTSILYKAQPGPWPTIAWYNNQFPYGVLNVYQTPGNSAELHLFTDTILQNLTLYSTIVLPQGYARALKWCLAKELCAEFGFPMTEAVKINAKDSLDMIKALNAKPASIARYDSALINNSYDAGYVIHGGYGR